MDNPAIGSDGTPRCGWAGSEPLYEQYHDDEWGRPTVDDEWGRPTVDDADLFEKMCLEAFQAGLSWITVLRKRDAFREVFDGFDVDTVARYDQDKIEALMSDERIIRNRAKIEATINNTRALQALWADGRTLAGLIWSHEPPEVESKTMDNVPTVTDESKALAKELKKLGFKFVGPTTVYAAMQAMGVVNDHVDRCHVRSACAAERSRIERPTA